MNNPGLTNEQKIALTSVRSNLIERLRGLDFDPALLENLSLFELVNLLFLCIGSTNYLGTFTGTCRALQDLFSWEVMSEKPSSEPQPQEEPKPLEKETIH
jgi:hypothetical protein